jgi:hypothetical protein
MKEPTGNVPPQRPVLERILIRSWEYRHLRFWAGFRFVSAISLAILGALTLSVRAYGWAALFLVPAALNFAFGYWELTIAYRLQQGSVRRVRELEQSRA